MTDARSDIKPENLLFYPIPFIPTKNPKPKGPEDEDKADEGEFIPGTGSGGESRLETVLGTTLLLTYSRHRSHQDCRFWPFQGHLGQPNHDTLWYCWLHRS